jgi:hypothetical protein
MQAAVLSVGTLILFQLAPDDAQRMSRALLGRQNLREQLLNLPKRELVFKSGSAPYEVVQVPDVPIPSERTASLLQRSNARYARPRQDVEAEIETRQGGASIGGLDAWA